MQTGRGRERISTCVRGQSTSASFSHQVSVQHTWRVIDSPALVEDPRTWPPQVADVLAPIAERLEGSANAALDLHVDDSAVSHIHAALQGTCWRVYHCTRLLPQERDDVLRWGLAPASDGLLEAKLMAAVKYGYLLEAEAAAIQASSMLAPNRRQRHARAGRICALTTSDSLADYHGLWRFLETWGGEIVHFGQSEGVASRLQGLGVPSVVVVDLPLDAPPTVGWYPPMERLLVASLLGMGGLRGETNQRSASAWPVTEIWQPGHPDYDERSWLPR